MAVIVDLQDRVHIVWIGNPAKLRFRQWSGTADAIALVGDQGKASR
jgi:hypothetical protein